MKSFRWIANFAVATCTLGASFSVLAAEPCEKNHYILSEPCAVKAVDAAIGSPGAVAVDTQGNVYFSSPNIVFKVDARGLLTRVAGNGKPGFSGDGGPATAALLNFPESYWEMELWPSEYGPIVGPLAVDLAGNLYVGDAFNNRVRRVDTNGVITTVLGRSDRADFGTPQGTARADDVLLWTPQGITTNSAGALFVSDWTGIVHRVTPDGAHTGLNSNGCGQPWGPGLCAPIGLAADAVGNLYSADGYCRVRRINAMGVITIAGLDTRPSGHGVYTCGHSGDGGPAVAAAMQTSYGVAVDAAGVLYIADPYNRCVRKVDGEGIITAIAGQCAGGTQWTPHLGDGGPATAALVGMPFGVAVDRAGNVFIADSLLNRIRKITPDGVMHTIAGNGEALPLPQ